jgi:hypothetical protein
LIPVKDASPVLISTGVEKSLPYTISKDFAVRARADGKVKEYDKNTNMMILAYKDGSHEAVNLSSVIVKNGGGGFYLANKLDTKFKVGQSFKKNDIIAADTQFFSKHYDGTKFNLGTLCKCAIMSSFATFEDAKLITQNLSERMATEMIMSKHLVLGQNATIDYIVKAGDPIHVGDDLVRYEVSNSEQEMNKLLRNIGEDMKEDIKAMGRTAIHSKYNGVIEEVRIYSTFELNELSPSLKKVVGDYWSQIRKKKALIKKYKITNPEDTGSTFYEADGPIKTDETGKFKGYKLEDGGVIFEFYIKFKDPVGIGDKLCDYAALKGVTCVVVPKGQEPYTPRRPKEEISTITPPTSILARMTFSFLPTIWGNKVLVELKDQLKEMYEAGKK